MPSGAERRRVLVVTSDPSLPEALIAIGEDVTPAQPDPTAGWIEDATDKDVVVLDIDQPVPALETVRRLRRTTSVPVLLIPGVDDAWEGLDTGDPLVRVLTLPLNAVSLSAAITGAASEPIAAGSRQATKPRGMTVDLAPTKTPLLPPRPVQTLPTAASRTSAKPAPSSSPASPQRTRPADQATSRPVAPKAAPPTKEPVKEQRNAAAEQSAPNPQPQPAPKQDDQPKKKAKQERPPRRFAAQADEPAQTPVISGPLDAETALALAQRVAPLVPSLPHLPTVALRVIDQVAASVPSEALALLVPDGDSWRVAGGQGLRRLEERAELPADHWLVGEIVRAQHGVLIEDTDIARGRLQRAPLAHWRQLLGAPAREFNGILLAGREDPAFTEEELLGVVALLERSSIEIKAALEVRALARQLEPFADHPGTTQ